MSHDDALNEIAANTTATKAAQAKELKAQFDSNCREWIVEIAHKLNKSKFVIFLCKHVVPKFVVRTLSVVTLPAYANHNINKMYNIRLNSIHEAHCTYKVESRETPGLGAIYIDVPNTIRLLAKKGK